MRDLQAARRAPLNPSAADEPAGATGADVETSPVVPERRPQLWPLFASVALLGLSLDVVTKVVAVRDLEPDVGVPAVGNLLTLRLIRNPGAAFSQGEGFTWVFAVAAVLVLGFVGVRLVPRLGHVGWAVALGLLVGRGDRQPGRPHLPRPGTVPRARRRLPAAAALADLQRRRHVHHHAPPS